MIFSVDNFCTIWSHLTSRTNDLTNLCWCCFSKARRVCICKPYLYAWAKKKRSKWRTSRGQSPTNNEPEPTHAVCTCVNYPKVYLCWNVKREWRMERGQISPSLEMNLFLTYWVCIWTRGKFSVSNSLSWSWSTIGFNSTLSTSWVLYWEYLKGSLSLNSALLNL